LDRRSLKWPIGLGIVMIAIVVVLIVGWVVLSLIGALGKTESPNFFWTWLSIGSVLLAFVLAGVIAYLTISVQAINLSRRQSNFIDSVTHELKSPIASLKLYLQTMSRRTVTVEERENFHRFMLEDVERLDFLIDHLLDAARVDRRSEPILGNYRLDQMLSTIAQGVCLRHHVPIETIRMDTSPALVFGSEVDLGIVFRNLLDNGIKYGGEPPQVSVVLRPAASGRVSIRIEDNGAGIPYQYRRRVFGRFVRLGNELERSRQGTGLGLYLVQTLVRQMKGSIRIRDRRNTSGTAFEVVLPGKMLARGDSETRPTTSSTRPL
jgi:signal transduction histidine kinase